jgi:hypothetical protein
VVLLEGEAGIGKTRTLEELAETARAEGATVLWGRCYEGEAARPYGPFAEALTEYARRAPAETLRADLGLSAAPLARMVPELRERLPDLPEPVALQADAERVRLLDAVAQGLLALAARTPTVVVLDDLHWADHGTVAMLRHVARCPRGRLLVLGAYRASRSTASIRCATPSAPRADQLRADRARRPRTSRRASCSHDRRPEGAGGIRPRSPGDQQQSVLHSQVLLHRWSKRTLLVREAGAGAPRWRWRRWAFPTRCAR